MLVKDEQKEIFWPDTKPRIKRGLLYPFIGDSISSELIFGKNYPGIIQAWATSVHYPFKRARDLAAVSQYHLMETKSPTKVRYDYFKFIKGQLLKNAERRKKELQIEQDLIKNARENLDDKSFTEIANQLGYLEFRESLSDPFSILATLPINVYVTTSYYQILEIILEKSQQHPVSVVYPWNQALEGTSDDTNSNFLNNQDYKPNAKEPLVIHLFGRDDDPASLVLTENDYLDFLIKLNNDMSEANTSLAPSARRILDYIHQTISVNSSPLILGYNLQDWDLRVLFRGLIGPKKDLRAEAGVCILQLAENETTRAEFEEFLIGYAKDMFKLNVYLGSAEDCLTQLRDKWRH